MECIRSVVIPSTLLNTYFIRDSKYCNPVSWSKKSFNSMKIFGNFWTVPFQMREYQKIGCNTKKWQLRTIFRNVWSQGRATTTIWLFIVYWPQIGVLRAYIAFFDLKKNRILKSFLPRDDISRHLWQHSSLLPWFSRIYAQPPKQPPSMGLSPEISKLWKRRWINSTLSMGAGQVYLWGLFRL